MEKIASFTIDHIKLEPGVYVSRKDTVGAEVITTFDLRMTSPNDEPVMNTAEMHTIEHLAATFLRNHAVYGSPNDEPVMNTANPTCTKASEKMMA
jgi:S-ribosylhomocysteine lyase